MAGVLLAMALDWTFVSTPAVVIGILVMCGVNAGLTVRAGRDRDVGKNELLVHATVDLILLTWLLAWSGGIRNPISVAFSFHVVLGALLNGRRGALWASALSLLCLTLLFGLEQADALPMRALHNPPAVLQVLSLGLLVIGLGYLALVIAERQTLARAALMEKLVVDKRHVMLERLATLGRAMQGVAHELNTPLTTMQTLGKDLKAALATAPLDDRLRVDVDESLTLLVEESQRCRTLTQTLLQHARDGRGASTATSLMEVATRALRLVGADEKDDVHLDASLDMAPPADADRVLQIVMNLLQNALLATQPQRNDGRGPRVVVRARVEENTLYLELNDRGSGLPDEVKARLFEPFVSTRAMGEGTGLGLYTSQVIAHELGGELTLSDGVSAGTSAVLALPMHS